MPNQMSQEKYLQRIEARIKQLNDIDLHFAVLAHSRKSLIDDGGRGTAKIAEEQTKISCYREQINRYGRNEWRNDFACLVQKYPETYSENAAVDLSMANCDRNQYWQELVDYTFPSLKKFQALFSEPSDFVIKKKRSHFEPHDLYGILISPERIPDSLLLNLHICSAEELDVSPLKKLEVKALPEVIDCLKLIFMKIAEKDSELGREHILREVHSQNIDTEKRLKNYNKYAVGQILILSQLNPQEDFKVNNSRTYRSPVVLFPKYKCSIYADADRRMRAAFHIKSNFDTELAKIRQCSSSVACLKANLALWHKGIDAGNKEWIKSKLLSTTNELHLKLKYARDTFKIKADDLLAKISAREDMRNNPQACMTVLTSVAEQFENRLNAAYKKLEKVYGDISVINSYITKSKSALKALQLSLSNYYSSLHSENESQILKEMSFAQLKSKILALEGIKIAPYLTFAKAIQNQFGEYYDNPTDSLKNIQLILDIYGVRDSFLNALHPNNSIQKVEKDIRETSAKIGVIFADDSYHLSDKTTKCLKQLSHDLGEILPKLRTTKFDSVRGALKKILDSVDITDWLSEDF